MASHGVPDTMMPAAPGKLTGAPYEGAIGDFTGIGALPYGSSFGPLTGKSRLAKLVWLQICLIDGPLLTLRVFHRSCCSVKVQRGRDMRKGSH